MPLFNQQGDILKELKETPFELEKVIQKVTEDNLEAVFGLKLIKSEFELNSLRIDTLAFDPETESFVVIEYKRDKNFSLVDQGLSYLSLMLNHKSDFILEYAKKTGCDLKNIQIDWEQSRIIFIARSFTSYQQNATNFKDFPIELYEVTRYDKNLVHFNKVKNEHTDASIKTITKSEEAKKISKEIKSYSESDVVMKGGKGQTLYYMLKEKLELIDSNLAIHATKIYISFRLPDDRRNIFVIWFRKDKILIELLRSEPKDFEDPEHRIKYNKSSMKHYGQHVSNISVGNEKELDYAVLIIKQLYEKFVKEK